MDSILSTCKECGAQFSYEPTAAPRRRYCGTSCRSAHVKRAHKQRLVARACSVDGCQDSIRSIRSGLCEKHYGRLRRRGTTDPAPASTGCLHSGGYVLIPAHGHPLREGKAGGHEYAHRVVFYDAFGEGPFKCHVCGAEVGWSCMHVDHLNDDVTDNAVSNLKPACPTCNQSRGRSKMAATHRANSRYQITWDGQTKCLTEWADIIGISGVGLRERLRRGWSVERALTTPPRR